jgi:hypothetical protein
MPWLEVVEHNVQVCGIKTMGFFLQENKILIPVNSMIYRTPSNSGNTDLKDLKFQMSTWRVVFDSENQCIKI